MDYESSEHATFELKLPHRMDPVECATYGDYRDMDYFTEVELDIIQKTRDRDGNSVLSIAAKYGHLGCCEVIYRRCPQLLYETNNDGWTALHCATFKYDFHPGMFLSAKLIIEADTSKKLLGMVNSDKDTAMHFAVKRHHLEIVELLVEADPHFEYSADSSGNIPIFIAWEEALQQRDNKIAEIRKLLIEKQPSQCRLPTGINKWTLIHHATDKGDLSAVKEIIHYYPDCCEWVDKEEQNFLHLAVRSEQVNVVKYVLELTNDSVLNAKDIFGNTPLHIAMSIGNYSIALALLDDSRVSKMAENMEGRKALNVASSVLLGTLIKDKYPIKCASKGDMDFLRAIHVDVLRESKDEDGESVLSTAARKGHLNCCEVIYERCPELLYQKNKNGLSTLHTAAANGRDEIVKFLLSARGKMDGKSVDCKLLMMVTRKHHTALHLAVEGGHLHSAKFLIQDEPSDKLLRMENLYKETAMHMAVKAHHVEIVKMLVEAHPNLEYSSNNDGSTPLLTALQEVSSGDPRAEEISQFLIEKQSTQCRIPSGSNAWTLLHHATYYGDLSAVKGIIDFVPDCCKWVDKESQNILHLAAKFDQVNVVKYILELTNLAENVLDAKDIFGNTPLHIAISCGNQVIAFALRDDPRVNKMVENLEGKTAFDVGPSVPFQCTIMGDVNFFRAIQADVLRESRNEDGDSLLSTSAMNGHLDCCEVISIRCPELLHQTNKNGASTLHMAASNGKHEIVKLLIEADDPSNKLLRMTDNHKETAMHYAVKKHHYEIVKLLVEADPDFEYSANDSGDTPHSIALREALSRDEITVDIRALLIQKLPSQCKIRTGRNGWTLLQNAASVADISAIEEIIQFCPDSSILVDKEGRNFLHLAVSSKHENVVNYTLGLRDISDNVLNGKDKNGDTPLHIATTMGSVSIALSLLYDHRVRKTIFNKKGKCPLQAIKFDYDKRRAGVLGLFDSVDENDLKDQTDFDLLVGALISTVSFTAGITVPGGFDSDGRNKGMAILHKKGTFVAFVAFNTLALALSLFAVFTHYCMKHMVGEKEIALQLKVATVCTIGSIFAMMVAFITGSLAVLSTSLLLNLIVCGISSTFFGCAFYSLWRMRRQLRRRRAGTLT